MSRKSNDQGRAFEFITLLTLAEEINKVREAVIEKNSSYEATKRAWENIDSNLQLDLKKAAEAALDAFMSSVEGALAKGEKVQLVGFGTFEVRQRAARKGRNPQTKAEIKIPASKAPVFKAGKALKETVNK